MVTYTINEKEYSEEFLIKVIEMYEKELNRKRAYSKQKYVPKNKQNLPTEPTESRNLSTEPTESRNLPTEPTESRNLPTEPTESRNLPTEPTESRNLPTEPTESRNLSTEPTESRNLPTEPSKYPLHLRTDLLEEQEHNHGELTPCHKGSNNYRNKDGRIIFGIPKLV
jgi:hypothetical protein